MKIKIPEKSVEDAEKFIRRCGYGRIFNRKINKISYARRLRGSFYPRFHIYMIIKTNSIEINLHLDQRQTRYKGVTAHSGEYSGELVQDEAKRIKNRISAS
ncbi:MAG: hypothetical protein ABH832_00135 [bacterium]